MIDQLSKLNYTFILKVAAGCIAIPRSMSLYVAMLGISAKHTYTWMPTVELLAGFAFAVLEAFAVAYIFSKWRVAKHDYVLLTFILVLVLSWFPMFAPGMVAEQNNLTIPQLATELVGAGVASYLLQLLHTGLVATIPMLVIAGVGYADSVAVPKQGVSRPKQKASKAKQEVSKVVDFKQEKYEGYNCACGQAFASKQALGGHARACKGVTA